MTFRRDALDATPTFADASVLFESNPSSWTDAFGRIRLAAQKGPVVVTGGYPRLVADLATAGDIDRYLAEGLRDENSNLVVVAERSLAAEFPKEAQARRVLTAIGGSEVGTVSFTAVVARLGEATSATQTALTRALKILSDDS